jgi:hypothetical protein
LRAAETSSSAGNGSSLTADQITDELIAALQLRLGVSLQDHNILVADLPPGYFGHEEGGAIFLDRDGAGFGWFIDETPLADEEFETSTRGALHAKAGSAAAGRIDLLTVLAHEVGHTLGLADLHGHDADLMGATLSTSTRRLSHSELVDQVFGQL